MERVRFCTREEGVLAVTLWLPPAVLGCANSASPAVDDSHLQVTWGWPSWYVRHWHWKYKLRNQVRLLLVFCSSFYVMGADQKDLMRISLIKRCKTTTGWGGGLWDSLRTQMDVDIKGQLCAYHTARAWASLTLCLGSHSPSSWDCPPDLPHSSLLSSHWLTLSFRSGTTLMIASSSLGSHQRSF